jgi:hypothetical protein
MLKVFSFLLTSLTLTLLKRTLSPQSVNLSLTICSLFLKLSQTGDLSFFFLLDSLKLCLLFLLSLSLCPVVFNNLLLKILFLALSLILDLDSALVSLLDFADHPESSFFLGLQNLLLISFHLFSLSNHLLHLTLSHLLFLYPVEFSLLDLINDDEGALLLSLFALNLTLLLQLE